MSDLPICTNPVVKKDLNEIPCYKLLQLLLVNDCWAVVVYDKDGISKFIFNQYMHYDNNAIDAQKMVELKRRQYYTQNPKELLKFPEVHIYMGFDEPWKCVVDHYGRRAFYD